MGFRGAKIPSSYKKKVKNIDVQHGLQTHSFLTNSFARLAVARGSC